MRTEQTNAAADLVSDLPKPEKTVDLDAFGAEYAARARRNTACDRWHLACPEKMRETNWQDPRIAPFSAQHAQILSWQYQDRGILASGPSGHGKTRAMWALMKRLAEEGREIRYFTAASWFSTLQQQFVFGRDESLSWVLAVAKVPVVFIDDLGQQAIQLSREDWAQGWLFQFLDARLGHGLPLFVTTNLTAAEMAGQSSGTRGNPLVRRLLDLCDVVKF
jgi:DNA replication protein DnaC